MQGRESKGYRKMRTSVAQNPWEESRNDFKEPSQMERSEESPRTILYLRSPELVLRARLVWVCFVFLFKDLFSQCNHVSVIFGA